MIEELSKFPPDARCYAYEGEVVGVVVVLPDPVDPFLHKELGYVTARETDDDNDDAVKARP